MATASTTKSDFDFRPNPPPKKVTFTVMFSIGISKKCASSLLAVCGSCTGAHTSILSPLNQAVALGTSIGACAKNGT